MALLISKEEGPGNHRLVSLKLISGKAMEQRILKTIARHIKSKKIISSRQNGFNKGKSCLINLRSFQSGLVDLGRTKDIIYQDFRKAFDAVSHKILIEKLLM